MKKKKPPIQLSLDMGNQDKIGLLVYNLALSSNTDEMYEAANVWRYKEALNAVIKKLRDLQDYGFEYEKSILDPIDDKSSRFITQKKKSKIDSCAFEHIITEVVKVMNEELDGLEW